MFTNQCENDRRTGVANDDKRAGTEMSRHPENDTLRAQCLAGQLSRWTSRRSRDLHKGEVFLTPVDHIYASCNRQRVGTWGSSIYITCIMETRKDARMKHEEGRRTRSTHSS